MTKKIELLAPAGSYESLVAAVQNGADAVYLGGTMFNARQNAANFDNEKLKEAVEYAHLRNVNVYLTLNTLLSDNELTQLSDYLIDVYSAGIDGIIIQDLGVAKFIKNIIPDIKLHASTQMTIHNLEGVLELQKMGFERVVLARELTLSEIQYICNNSTVDIEVFIHGALCVCYSGQCLMSSLIGGRSGNRGLCAQPCRLPYSIEGVDNKKLNHGYLLSPKDLYSLNNIGDVISSGVKSLKIEGRMKRPEYVAIVVRIYRKYIDMYLKNNKIEIDKNDELELLQIFNRGGFTKGHFYEKQGSSMMCYEKPSNWGVYIGSVQKYNSAKREVELKLEMPLSVGDGIEFWQKNKFDGMRVNKIIKNKTAVKHADRNDIISLNVQNSIGIGAKVYKTSSIELLDKALHSYSNENKIIGIDGIINIKENEPITLKLVDIDKNVVEVCGDINVEKAINRPITEERVIEQLQKLGDTPFKFVNLECNIDSNISVPISEINNLRRNATEKLINIRKEKSKPILDKIKIKENAEKILHNTNINNNQNTKLSVYLSRIITGIINQKVDRYYIPVTQMMSNKQKAIEFINTQKNSDTQIYMAMPRIIRKDLINSIKKTINELDGMFDGILLTGIGQKELFDGNCSFSGDFSFNVFNSLSVEFLAQQDLDSITLSPELKNSQIKNIINSSKSQKELIVYGRLPVMISEYCPTGSIVGNSCQNKKCSINCKEEFRLVDRLDNRFPIMTDRLTCQSQILNSKKLFLGEELQKIVELNPNYIRLNFTIEDAKEINDMIKFHREFLDKGKEVFDTYKEYINKVNNDFTRGHYFRGVE